MKEKCLGPNGDRDENDLLIWYCRGKLCTIGTYTSCKAIMKSRRYTFKLTEEGEASIKET